MSYFHSLNSIWGPFTVDCFANSVNAKVPRFYSLFFQPGCFGVDALAFDWGGENCWLVPAVYLIPRVLCSRAEGAFDKLSNQEVED